MHDRDIADLRSTGNAYPKASHPSKTSRSMKSYMKHLDKIYKHNGIARFTPVEVFKVDAPKKKVKKTNVPLTELLYGAMFTADVQKAVEKEFEMAFQDRVMEEIKDKKNVVEAYVYPKHEAGSDYQAPYGVG